MDGETHRNESDGLNQHNVEQEDRQAAALVQALTKFLDAYEKQQAKQEAEHRKNRLVAVAAVIVAGLAFVTAFWQADIAGDALREARQASESSGRETQAALAHSRVALDLARQSQAIEHRAWLTVRSVTLTKILAIGEKPRVAVTVINSGKTPALDTRIGVGVFSRRVVTDRDFTDEVYGVGGSRSVIGPSAPFYTTQQSDEAFSRPIQIEAIRDGSAKLYAKGVIFYKDIFGRPHRTRFCYYTVASDLEDRNLGACDRWNDAD